MLENYTILNQQNLSSESGQQNSSDQASFDGMTFMQYLISTLKEHVIIQCT